MIHGMFWMYEPAQTVEWYMDFFLHMIWHLPINVGCILQIIFTCIGQSKRKSLKW
jgi:hypothetical protein